MDDDRQLSPAPVTGEVAESGVPDVPRNTGMELDELARRLAQAITDTFHAWQVVTFLEAERRARLKGTKDAEGRKRSRADIRDCIILARNDPDDEIGAAWDNYVAFRNKRTKLEMQHEIWKRAHKAEAQKGWLGI